MMSRKDLVRRLDALQDQRASKAPLVILQRRGETEEEAAARYLATYGRAPSKHAAFQPDPPLTEEEWAEEFGATFAD